MKHKLVSFLTVIVACSVIFLAKDGFYLFLWLVIVATVFLAFTAYGAYEIRFNYFLKSVNSGNSDHLVLTFDDGPDPLITPAILKILRDNRVRATFFLIGKKAEEYPELVRQIQGEGHEIGNHSYSHSYDLGFFSENKLLQDLRQCSEILNEIVSKKVTFFRPPFGVTNPRYARVVKQLGLISIGWSLRSMDTKIKSKDELLERITTKLNRGNIILLHDTQQVTLEILPSFFDFCNKNGFQFRTLSESIGIRAYSDVK